MTCIILSLFFSNYNLVHIYLYTYVNFYLKFTKFGMFLYNILEKMAVDLCHMSYVK